MEQWNRAITWLLDEAGFSMLPLSELEPLSGDGSDRIFFRVMLAPVGSVLAVFPSPSLPEKEALAESRSTYLIGKHLGELGVPVPRVFSFEPSSGAVLFEDLGQTLLFSVVCGDKSAALPHYRQALESLVLFQVDGCQGFQKSYCWDTVHYDRKLMRCRESGYFEREFCRRHLGLYDLPASLGTDFDRLAERVASEDSQFLLHRDYQSRNLMITPAGVRIIDFQGARFGPLGYDVASLLNDPYVALSPDLKKGLLNHYLEALSARIDLDRASFLHGYYHIALQRNLQVLGAFAFLSRQKKKVFFREFIGTAFSGLLTLLTGELAGDYPSLEELIKKIAGNGIDIPSGV